MPPLGRALRSNYWLGRPKHQDIHRQSGYYGQKEVDRMSRQFDVVVEKDSEGYFLATVPVLPGCHTQARSLDQLMERIKEAIELCLEVEDAEQETLDFVGIQRVTVEV